VVGGPKKHTRKPPSRLAGRKTSAKSYQQLRYDITHAPINQNHSSLTIDLVIANPKCRVKVRHRIIASTEHRALEVKTNLTWRETTEKLLRLDKADWGGIEAELMLIDEKDTHPTRLQENLTRIILAHTPRATGKAKVFWNKDLANMRKIILLIVAERTGGKDLVEARRNFRKAITQAKIEANDRTLQEETDPECFRTVKLRATKHSIPALQRADNIMAAEHDYIAAEIQNSLYDGEHTRGKPETITPSDPNIDEGEIQTALQNCLNGAAPGPDSITTRLLRLLWKTKKEMFSKVINQVFKNRMPESWKNSSTILIPKAKKPSYMIAKSWRPIQLQSILGKLIERIVTLRLVNLKLLPDNMYGGRKRYGMMDMIQALDTFVNNNKHRNICLTVLDVAGGFDLLRLGRTCDIIGQRNKHLAQ